MRLEDYWVVFEKFIRKLYAAEIGLADQT